MGSIRMFIGVVVLVGGAYVAVKVVPPYFNNYEFQDWLKDEATRDSYSPKSETDIRQAVLKKAQEYDIPLMEEGIQVQRSGNSFSGNVTIRAPYVVHVDLPIYPLDLHFDAGTENKGVF
jgi:hypothetical protein